MSDIKDRSKTFSIFVEKSLPKFVDEDHPDFVEFVKKYFEFLEQEYNSLDLIINYLIYNDVDYIMEDLKKYYKEIYASSFPEQFFESFSFFIKHVREFYQMKGSEESFKYLFREMFNAPVDFFYPSTKVFRISDANWHIPYYLVSETQNLDKINDFKNHPIRGQSSLAEGYVTEINYIKYSDSPFEKKYVLNISNREGFFIDGETIKSLINPDLTMDLKQNDAILEKEGEWVDRSGMLSGNSYLQDNYYYQDFSYELKTSIDISDYKDLIKKIAHPAGFAFFFAIVPFLNSIIVENDNIESQISTFISWTRTPDITTVDQEQDNLLDNVVKIIELYLTSVFYYEYTFSEVEDQIMLDNQFNDYFVINDLELMPIEYFEKRSSEEFIFTNASIINFE